MYYFIIGTTVDKAKKSLLKEKLGRIQKSYSETFSIHELSRIIHSGWKERVIWSLLFLAALVGLAYMSKGIIEHFINKDVRTEVRMEQRESQPWPSIIICSKATIAQHYHCYKNVNTTDIVSPNFCSRQLKLPKVIDLSENQRFDVKGGCVVYNLNGTLKQEGGLARGLDIQYQEMNSELPLLGIDVYFYDSRVAKSSGNIPFLIDIDMGDFGSLAPRV